MKKKAAYLILRIVISAGLIGYFLFSLAKEQGGLAAALHKFASAFGSAGIHWLIPAFLAHLLGFSLVSLRWGILLRPQGVKAPFTQLFLYYFMAAFFNTFLPSTIGGDAVRAIESKKLTGEASTSVTVIIVERLSGMFALVLIALTALAMKFNRSGEDSFTGAGFVAVVLVGFACLVVVAHPTVAPRILRFTGKFLPGKVQSFLEKAYQVVSAYFKYPGSLLAALGISIVFQLNMVAYYYFIARALNQSPDPVDFMFKAPILIFLLMTVPTVNGIGVRTYVFIQLMKFPKALALSAEAIDLGLKYIYGLLGGLVFLLYRRGNRRKDVSRGKPDGT